MAPLAATIERRPDAPTDGHCPPGPISDLREELADILGVNRSDIPPIFRGKRVRALKIGVHFDILATFPGVDAQRVSDWLDRYTATTRYLQAIIHRHNRHDLDGNDVGRIELASKHRAARKLARLRGVPPC